MKEEQNVICKKEKVLIPTYGIGKPEKNPIFCENRVYQGSSGTVYPHPIIEKIYDEKEDKEWLAIYLENKYIKIMILPELGGRVQMAYDKIKKRHFVYYNSVIKPALVGLTGPWISGGIEFNWPQHHRPSTYEPVDYYIEENKDGSITVWCSEIERMFRTKGMAGFTLYKDKAYLEIKVKLYNRTYVPQTFLWWANPAVKVNDDYQSVFPPDVYAVFDHGKRDVSDYPIAKGTYYKVDYSSGVDISRYKNIPVPTSFMAVESKYNFVGCYENDTKGGMLHVANHHVSPGKKQWTWGNGDFGRAWDRNLTDKDGPYIELMCGVFTDNQPDFSWLMPNEEKSFSQYFMPYHEIGLVKNASKDILVNLEFENNKAKIRVYTTSEFSDLKITFYLKEQILFEETYNSSPESSYNKSVELYSDHKEEDFSLTILNNRGKKLLEYKPEPLNNKKTPEPAKAIKSPQEINSVEKLYLAGLHLEQYRHATFNPTDYYLEALNREPDNIQNNNSMGMWLLRHGRFDLAEPYFRKAIKTITTHNPNPYDGEPFYNLGLCFFYQEKLDEAYNYFYKSIWNSAWQENGYFQLAKISCIRNEFSVALELVEKSLIKNWHNHKARHLKVAILRKLDKVEEALNLCEDSLTLDQLNFGVLYEKYLLTKNDLFLKELLELLRNNVHTFIEYALDYAHAGYYDEASSFLELYIKNHEDVYPMAGYFLGWFALKCNDEKNAKFWFIKAEQMNPDYCFPNRLEEAIVLQSVLELLPECSKANYYLGNFWYASKQYEKAIECWENSRELDDSFPTVRRNLALAYFNKLNNSSTALLELEKAFELDPSDARVLMELDQLYKKLGKDFEFRLSFLAKHLDLVNFRDDLYLERITLLNFNGKFEEALELLLKRKFHPWEGGEGKVTGQYIFSLTEMAKQEIKEKNAAKAIELLERAKIFPHNLGEGKLAGAKEIDINYWLGCANEIINNNDKAIEYWKMASEGDYEPSIAMYYNDQKPDNIFYQGLALRKLGEIEKDDQLFKTLCDYGKNHINDHVEIDYFAVSLPDLQIWEEDLNKVNRLHCQYLIALGYLGQGKEEAIKLFSDILNVDMYNLGAHIHQQFELI